MWGSILVLYNMLKWKTIRACRNWVDPINVKRLTLGAYYTLFEELRLNEKKFFNYKINHSHTLLTPKTKIQLIFKLKI